MASQWPPKKGAEFTLEFTLYKNDGSVIANPGTITKKISKDGGGTADISNSITEIDTTYGHCSVVLTTSEMSADRVWVYIKDDTTGCVPFTATIYTVGNTQDEIKTAIDTIDGIVDDILVDTGTTLDTLIKDIPTTAEFEARSLPAADYTVVSDLGTVQTGDSFAIVNSGTHGNAALKTLIDTVDTVADGIKAKTDSLTFTVAGDVDVNVQSWKDSAAPDMTGDAFARLGAPAGLSVSADIAAAKAETAAILEDTGTTIPGTLTTIDGKLDTIDNFVDTEVAGIVSELAKVPKSDGLATWNATALASIQGECTDALNAYDPPTKTELDAGLDALPTAAEIKVAIEAAGSHLALILEDTGTTLPATLATISGYIDTEVATILAAVDTEVAAIKAKTDQLNFTGTDVKATLDGETVTVGVNNDKTGYALTAAYDAAKTAASQTSVDTVDGIVDAILEDTGTTIPGLLSAMDGKIDTVDTVADGIKAKTDSLTFTVAGDVDVNVQSWKGAAAPEMTGDAYARLGAPAGLSVSADIAAVKSDTAAVLVDTNELQVDLTNGGRLDLILDGILEDTGTTLPGTLSTIEGEVQVIDGIADAILVDTGTTLPATLSTISGYIDTEVAATLAAVDTEVAAIKAKTDNLPLDPADQSAVEAAITAAHATTNSKIDTVDGIVDGIFEDTGTTLPATLTAIEGKIDTIDTVSDSLTSELAKVPKSDGVVTWNLTALASIQQEATDALNAYDPPTKTEMDAGLDVIPTVAEIRTEMEKAGTHLTLILEDTGTTLPGTLSTISGYVDTEVAAIKAKTDQLNFVGTDVKATLDSEKVVVVSNEDKTGYALTAAYDEAKTAAQAGDKMDLVDVLSSGAVGVIQNGLATQASVDVIDGLVDEIKTSTDKFATMIVVDGTTYQFTENSLSLVPVATGSLTAGQVADAVCEELLADHDDVAGSLAEAIANYTGVGPGTGTLTYTLTYLSGETNIPIPNAIVWLTTDLGGLNKVRSGVTNEFGVVTFDFLAGGNYYVWRSCPGFYFDNPDVEEVTE